MRVVAGQVTISQRLDLFQIFYTLLTSLNARTSRDLGGFQSDNLAESAPLTGIQKDDWSRAVLLSVTAHPHHTLSIFQHLVAPPASQSRIASSTHVIKAPRAWQQRRSRG
jgi:hypothetical protein